MMAYGNPDQILERLFLTSYEGAAKKSRLKQHGITHILTILPHAPEWRGDSDFTCLHIPKEDSEQENILEILPTAIKFIDEGREKGGVVVHCAAGVSRSATVVIAYVMKHKNLSFKEAYALVKKARPIISPNNGFQRQLRIFEAMNKELDLANPREQYLLYLMEHNMKHWLHFSQATYSYIAFRKGLDPKEFIHAESARKIIETFQTTSTGPSAISEIRSFTLWTCANCGRMLFTPIHIYTEHAEQHVEEGVEKNFIRVEELTWMNLTIDDRHSEEPIQLKCPDCHEVVGMFRRKADSRMRVSGMGSNSTVSMFIFAHRPEDEEFLMDKNKVKELTVTLKEMLDGRIQANVKCLEAGEVPGCTAADV